MRRSPNQEAGASTRLKWIYGFFLAACMAAFFVPAASARDVTPDCGAHQQQKCEFKPATKIGSVIKKHCASGFFDPRNGGECWSCPAETKRTVFAVTSNKACQEKGRITSGFSSATKLNNKPRKLGCGSGEIRDMIQGGTCWKCPEHYNRSIHPINGSLACTVKANLTCDQGLKVKSDARCYDPEIGLERAEKQPCGGLYQLKCEFAHANYISQSKGLSCDRGFWDPRKGGECWECPEDYNRSIHPVTGHLACTAPASQTCEPGLKPDFGNICVYSEAGKVEAAARAQLEQYALFVAEAILLAADIEETPGIVEALKGGDDGVADDIEGQRSYSDATDADESDAFQTLSVGVVSSANTVFIGGTVENGAAFDITGATKPVKWYGSADYKMGPALSVDQGLNISFWTSENDGLTGDSHGFVLGLTDVVRLLSVIDGAKDILELKPGFSFAITMWYNYDMEFIGFSVTPVASIGVDLGGYARAKTVQVGP